ncbi:hypothetical protein D5085_16190 [Ectothiorhodospiraceae bacterium BW-2]|nr:hypothetical protein D5085_16180 [Ectothiorhodospiraceae bacterium BW-2]QEP44537.1 hypothetical protein D5085_16190 [Ectothiorhodospiraceae bacterium BW-2]
MVILVNEYDKPILDKIENLGLAAAMREQLTAFYTVLCLRRGTPRGYPYYDWTTSGQAQGPAPTVITMLIDNDMVYISRSHAGAWEPVILGKRSNLLT